MTRVSDEDLGAFLDGELAPEERDAVQRLAATDPVIRSRLDHMRAANEALRAAFPSPQTRLDDPLARRIRDASKAPDRAGGKPVWSRERRIALAAGLTGLTIGIGASAFRSESDPSALGGTVRAALESSPSGETRNGVRVLFSFNTDGATPCRQFVAATATLAGEGVACRKGSAWSLAAWVETGPETTGTFRAAAGEDPLEAVVDRLDRSGPLSEADERRLLERRWRAP